MAKTLTRAMLVVADACGAALAAFDRECPDGLTLDAAGVDLLLAQSDGVDWADWLVRDSGLCPVALWAEYDAKVAPLRAEYNAKRDALWAEYDAPLRAEYNAKVAPLLRATLLAWGVEVARG